MWDKNMQYHPRQDPWALEEEVPRPPTPQALQDTGDTDYGWLAMARQPAPASALTHFHLGRTTAPSHHCHSHTSSWGRDRRLPLPFSRQEEATPWTAHVRPHSGTRRAMRHVTSEPEQSHSATQASKRNLSHLVQAIIRGLGRRSRALHLFTSSPSSAMHACLITSAVSDSLWPHGLWSARLLCPWGFPGKNTGVGRHSLLHPQL